MLARAHGITLMFEGLRRRFLDLRVDWAFPRFEQLALTAHMAEAEWRFESSQLRTQVELIRSRAAEAAKEKFSEETNALERELDELAPRLKLMQSHFAILTRDYKSEIDGLYKRKDALIAESQVLGQSMEDLQRERANAQENLSNAYAHLQHVKDGISSWHNESKRSQWLFGNKGKKLPKHAIFGQSFGDLDDLKAGRDRAARAIGECKATINEIEARKRRVWEERQEKKSAVAAVHTQIDAVKVARGHMFDLRGQGLNPSNVGDEIAELTHVDTDFRARRTKVQAETSKFIKAVEGDLGIRDREAEILAIGRAKDQFVSEFHTEERRAARRREHRDQWLKARG